MVGGLDVGLERERLNQEVTVNAALQGLMARAAQVSAKAASNGANAYGAEAGQMFSILSNAERAADGLETDTESMEKGVENEMAVAGANSEVVGEQLDKGSGDLAAEEAAVQAEAAAARGAMTTQKLERLSAAGSETESKYSQLESWLMGRLRSSKMSGGSLLQTNESSFAANASSLLQTLAAMAPPVPRLRYPIDPVDKMQFPSLSPGKRRKALAIIRGLNDTELANRIVEMRKFRDDLVRSNAKLRSQNSELEKGLAMVEAENCDEGKTAGSASLAELRQQPPAHPLPADAQQLRQPPAAAPYAAPGGTIFTPYAVPPA